VAREAGLGRDHEFLGVRMQRLVDQLLGDERPVRVGCVDERDAQLDRAPEHADGLVGVRRLAPDALAGQLHRAVAEPVDGRLPADLEGAGVRY